MAIRVLFLLILFLPMAQARVPFSDTQDYYSISEVVNGGAENFVAGWIKSSDVNVNMTTSSHGNNSRLFGSRYFDIDFTTDGDYVTQQIFLPEAYRGKSCEVSYWAMDDNSNISFQVLDGSFTLIKEEDFTGNTAWYKKKITFDCPESSILNLRITNNVASAAGLYIDNIKFGLAQASGLQYERFYYEGYIRSSSAQVDELMGGSGEWLDVYNGNNATLVNKFGTAEIACASGSSSGSTCGATDEAAGITLDLPSSGKYKVCNTMQFQQDNNDECHYFKISRMNPTSQDVEIEQGENRIRVESVDGSSAGSYVRTCETFDVAKGLNTFKTRQRRCGSAGSDYRINDADERHDWTVEEIQERAIENPIDEGFEVSAKISGDNFANVLSNLVPEASDATMESIKGNVKIPCTGGNPSGTATCSAGDEQLGFVFTVPQGKSGDYEVCMQSVSATGTSSNMKWRLAHFQNDSDTIIKNGDSYTFQESSDTVSVPFRQCDNFDLSAGENTIKVAIYDMLNNANFFADGGPTAVFSARLKSKNVKSIITTDAITTGESGLNEVNKSCYISNPSGTPSASNQLCNSWVDSITDNGVGVYTLNFSSGTFTETPICTLAIFNSDNTDARTPTILAQSSSSLVVKLSTLALVDVDDNINVSCHGVQ